MTRHRSWFLVLLLLTLAPPARALAQSKSEIATPPSERSVRHRDLGLPEGGTNPEELINNRLQRARGEYDAQKLAQMIRDNPELEKKLAQMIREMKQQSGTGIEGLPHDLDVGKLPDEWKQRLPQIIQDSKVQSPESGAAALRQQDIEGIGKRIVEELNKGQAAYPPGAVGGSQSSNPMGNPDPRGAGATQSSGSGALGPESVRPGTENSDKPPEVSREFTDFVARHFRGMDSSSPSVQRAMKALERFKMDGDNRWLKWNEGKERLNSSLPDWVKSIKPDRFRPERGWPFERGLDGSTLRRIDFTNKWVPSGPRINVGNPGLAAAEAGTGLMWIMVIAVAAVVLWKLLTMTQILGAARKTSSWRLGPWPVNPAAVRTREDIVKAFEYVSLLLLGPGAGHRNHLQLAADMSGNAGQASMERDIAARHLAALYEQARYAPPQEPLPENELPAARRYLCYLAGVWNA